LLLASLFVLSVPAAGLAAHAVSAASGPALQQVDEKQQFLAEGIQAIKVPYFDRAQDAFRRAARIDRRDPEPRMWLGRVQFERRGGDLDLALEEFDRALELDASHREARYWKARTLQRLGGGRRLQEAMGLYEGLIPEDPLYRDVIFRLTDIHVTRGTLDEYLLHREQVATASAGDPLATFRYAEAIRRYGEIPRAESLLRGLRENHRDFAPGRVLFQLALAYYDQELWEEGTEFYLDAITFMRDEATARMMWEDAHLIADLDELQRFRMAETVEDFRELLRGFWKKRDAIKTTVENERIGVHYERLAVCWRSYQLAGIRRTWNDPDEDGRLRKPPTYDAESVFNDMGLIYLRWGDPDDRAWHHEDGLPENMSWKYEAKGTRREFIVHFEQNALGGGWRLVATPRPGASAIARTSLDPKYGALQRGADPQIMNMLIEDANADIREALTRDAHIPEFESEPLTLFTDVASFKGAGGRTRFELYWAVPLMEMMSTGVVRDQVVHITMNISVFTRDYAREVYRNSREQRIPIAPGTPINAMIVDQEEIPLPPGDYVIALEVRENTGDKLQIQEMFPTVKDFPDGQLSISDIQIAQSIREGEGPRFVKPGYTIIPLPTRVYMAGQPARIYFGIYGLAKDDIGATRYRISYQLEPTGVERGTLGRINIGGLLGRRGSTGGVEVTGDEESGILNDVHKVLTIDVGESSFKTYRLRIRVEDLVSGTRTEQVSFFHLDRSK
jgi:tetratricopeptide (TPR) repeat protein